MALAGAMLTGTAQETTNTGFTKGKFVLATLGQLSYATVNDNPRDNLNNTDRSIGGSFMFQPGLCFGKGFVVGPLIRYSHLQTRSEDEFNFGPSGVRKSESVQKTSIFGVGFFAQYYFRAQKKLNPFLKISYERAEVKLKRESGSSRDELRSGEVDTWTYTLHPGISWFLTPKVALQLQTNVLQYSANVIEEFDSDTRQFNLEFLSSVQVGVALVL